MFCSGQGIVSAPKCKFSMKTSGNPEKVFTRRVGFFPMHIPACSKNSTGQNDMGTWLRSVGFLVCLFDGKKYPVFEPV